MKPAKRWLLPAAGVLILIALGLAAGLGLRTWRAADGDPVIATVNDATLRLSDVYRQVNALSLGDQIDARQQLQRFAGTVIDAETLYQYGLGGELRDELKNLVVERVIDRLVKDKINVSDDDIARYYQEHIHEIRGEHLHVFQIQLAQRSACEQLQPQIDSLDTFQTLARERSLNPDLAERGGDMGHIMRHFDQLGFEAQLFDLPLQQVHTMENAEGCYLVWLDDYLDPPPPPLAEVAPNLRLRLERLQEIELLQALLEDARGSVKIERFALPQ